MRYLLIAVGSFFISLTANAQPRPSLSSSAQNSEPTFTKENIWHLNMELVETDDHSFGGEQGYSKVIGSDYYVIAPRPREDNHSGSMVKAPFLRLMNATDPRDQFMEVKIIAKSEELEDAGLNNPED